jgi:hypothetical protein
MSTAHRVQGSPSQVNGVGLRTLSRRRSWVRIPPPALSKLNQKLNELAFVKIPATIQGDWLFLGQQRAFSEGSQRLFDILRIYGTEVF